MTSLSQITRRALLVGAAAVATLPARAQSQKLRVGVQKYGTLIVLEVSGALEKRLTPKGVSVEWTEFPAGPQLSKR